MAENSGFTIVPRSVIELGPKIGSLAFHLFAILMDHANEGYECWPSIARLAELTGMTQQSVRNQLKKLKEHDVIAIKNRKDGSVSLSNLYKILTPYQPPKRNGGGTLNETIVPPSTKRKGDPQRNVRGIITNEQEPLNKRARTQFVPPSFEEIQAYCQERKNQVNPQRFLDHYTSNGWKVGRAPMKDWRAAIRTWERNGFSNKGDKPEPEIEYSYQ